MTLIRNTLSIVTVLCAFIVPAQADDDTGFYIGAGYAATDYNDDNFDDSVDQLGLRTGYMFTDNFGIDLTGTLMGDASSNNVDAEVGVFAISAIASVPLGEYFDLYGKLGGAQVRTSTSIGDTELSDESSTELYWGIGGEIDFGVINLFLEYNRFDTDAVNINTAMAGIKLEF